jgi:type I restriction enzyme S subunit
LVVGEHSAENLLKKIKEEKEHLIKENKIKKQKQLPPIAEKEKPFELPEGWAWCRMGEFVILSENLNIHSKFTQDTLINYVDLDCVDNKRYFLKEIKNKKVSDLSTRARRVLQKGYISYSLVRPYLNNICIIDKDKENFIGSTGFCVFKPTWSQAFNATTLVNAS